MERILDLLKQLADRMRLSLPETVTLFLVATFIGSLLCMLLFAEVADEMLDQGLLVAFDQWLAEALYNRATEGRTLAFGFLTLFGSQVVIILTVVIAVAAEPVWQLCEQAATELPDFELVTEPDANHAFFNDTGQRYNTAAATDAWQRVQDWFARYL